MSLTQKILTRCNKYIIIIIIIIDIIIISELRSEYKIWVCHYLGQ